MKCEVTSHTTHDVLISKEISWKSYKEICTGEPKKVNFGYNNSPKSFKAENNKLMPYPAAGTWLYGEISKMSFDWEVLYNFFAIHNIEPNWLDCKDTYGWFDEDLGGWTGCMGKVGETEY